MFILSCWELKVLKIYSYVFSEFQLHALCLWAIYEYILYMIQEKWVQFSCYFYIWVLSCPSTICWKDYTFPHWIILAYHLKPNDYKKCDGFFRLNSSLLLYLSSCQYVHCIARNFKVWKNESFNFVLLRIVFISLSPLISIWILK